ncbi:aldehyde dehydrogenase family protein [Dyadobacter tibetensis]|uniref:aldehyde dehydrogenase family protein n=1 Tax=Dyadobacter tibetensis TaxID=1211851 RepID=UPI00046EA3CD|nr:aldehyde dehydrogenase family protein [Dyadobacter tibetensis]
MTNSEIEFIFQSQKANKFVIGQTVFEERKRKLIAMKDYLLAHLDTACEATAVDLQKPKSETLISEIFVLINEINYTVKHLKKWMKPARQVSGLAAIGTSNHIYYESKGQVLIISPWNYPINLALKPLISAVAAGCVAILKPSELTPASSSFLSKMIETIFPSTEVKVVEGNVEVAQKLLEQPFDHIFFTGSTAVGKIVMKAASKNLTSVTLELGGKSPCIIDASCDLESTARLIAWGKFFNAGQTCIAPDYVLIERSIQPQFMELLGRVISKMYDPEGKGVQASSSLARIINGSHFDRLVGYLQDAENKGAQILIGGQYQSELKFIAPTVIDQVKDDMLLMREEIFGPILPIIPFADLSEAIDYVNARDKPLALYIHSKHQDNIERVLRETSSGNALVNEVLSHFGNPDLPFGGVNQSGIGKSNGFYGFVEFSNPKGVMKRRFGTIKFLFPPYGPKLEMWLRRALKWM